MPKICHYYYGLHSSAEQIKNMTDYERCLLFELIKLLCTKNAKNREEKPTSVQDNNFVNLVNTFSNPL